MRERMELYEGENLAFIVGAPRSGTTWLQKLVASHPRVRTGPESYVFVYIDAQLKIWRGHLSSVNHGHSGVGLACYFEEQEFISLVRDYTALLLEPMISQLQPGEIFLDKTPMHALFISEIASVLPRSRILHILRDPRDVVASMLAASRSWGSRWAPSSASVAARQWANHVMAVRESAKRLAPEQFLEINYEELRRSPHATLGRVFTHLGLEWSEELLDRAVSANSVENSRAGRSTTIPVKGEFGRISGPVFKLPEGFVRKGQPGSWRKDLSVVEKLQAWRAVRQLAAEVGYPWPLPFSS